MKDADGDGCMLEETQHLAEYVRQLVTHWRERFSNLSSAEQDQVGGSLDDFRAPCQVTVFWIRNSTFEVDQQLWVITRFESEPDLDISVHGPIATDRVLSELSAGLDNARFERALPDSGLYFRVETYRQLIESHLLRLVENVQSNVMRSLWGVREPRGGIGAKQRLSEAAFTWELLGDTSSLDLETIVEGMIAGLQTRVNIQTRATPENRETPREAHLPGFGTYLYPQIWIGERPTVPFEQRLRAAMFGRDPLTLSLRFQDAIFFEKFGDFHVIAQQNGYIGVTIPDRQLAMESLNIFMSLATLRGIPALAITDNELGSITVDPDLGRIIRSSNTLTLPRMAPADPSYRLSTLELELREPLEIPTLRQLWEETESVSHHSPSAGLIYLFGQIYTQYQNEAYSETVIFASMWVEQLSHIARANYIVGEDFSPSHLRRPGLFDALRLFSEIEEIDPKIEIGLRDLVHARSGALHRNEKATKDQAESALLVVTHLIQTLPRLVRGS